MSRSVWKGPFVDPSLLKLEATLVRVRLRGSRPTAGSPEGDLISRPSPRGPLKRASLGGQSSSVNTLLPKGMPGRREEPNLAGSSPSSTASNHSRTRTPKIWSRRSCILPQFVGNIVQIYNGRSFVALKITEDMVGHKFGEFASTRKTRKKGK